MADLQEVNFYLSGGTTGAGNTDTTKSTGGVLTTTKILNQSATLKSGSTAIPGITLSDAQGNAVGDGTLTYTYTASTKTARWTPPSGSIGTAVDIDANGTYALQGANDGGVLEITVVAASLPSASTTMGVTIALQANKIFDNITKAQSLAGLTEYRCIYIKNDGTVATDDDKVDVEVYISQQPTGADVISIALDLEGAGTGTGVAGTDYPADTTSETTAPAGVTFTSPTSDAPLSSFDLSSTAGSTFCRGIWIKREVPAGTDEETLDDNWQLSFNVKV